MFEAFFKNMSHENQGVLAIISGLILILGTLGKLGILQGILDSIMILIGLAFFIWGFNSSNAYHRIKVYFNKKQ